jgi:hypothetical protein
MVIYFFCIYSSHSLNVPDNYVCLPLYFEPTIFPFSYLHSSGGPFLKIYVTHGRCVHVNRVSQANTLKNEK